jgi:hypothetical protein
LSFRAFSVLRFLGIKVSGYEVSMNLDFEVSRIKGFVVSRNKGFVVSRYQGFKVSGL